MIDGAVRDDVFLAYVQQHLAPTLRPGDVVIPNNLASHRPSAKPIIRVAMAAADLVAPDELLIEAKAS